MEQSISCFDKINIYFIFWSSKNQHILLHDLHTRIIHIWREGNIYVDELANSNLFSYSWNLFITKTSSIEFLSLPFTCLECASLLIFPSFGTFAPPLYQEKLEYFSILKNCIFIIYKFCFQRNIIDKFK